MRTLYRRAANPLFRLHGRCYNPLVNWQTLPGGDLIQQGLTDLAASAETIPAFLVAIGAPRLRRLGFEVAETFSSNPEHRLYLLLAAEDPDSAHSRYNALIRRLVSFERCVG